MSDEIPPKLDHLTRLLLTEELRLRLKQPLGQLIKGSPKSTIAVLRERLREHSPPRLVLVGDSVSRNAMQNGIKPDVVIIDGREMRKQAPEFQHQAKLVLRTTNEPGTISQEARKAVETALQEGNCLVAVSGEEDLLTLVAVLGAPDGSLVVYGQPKEGIVLVQVNEVKKNEIKGIVDMMRREA